MRPVSPASLRPLAFGLATAVGLVLAAPAFAQTAASADAGQPAPTETAGADEEEVEELVVTAARAPLGAVPGPIPPEIQLGPREIRALGASTVTELLEALAPQISSGRGRGGRPVILLNGARISSFDEVRDLPPEAIIRVDILPEEVALQYGYRADQRVVNFVLRPRFRAITAEAAVRAPTQGGRESFEGDLDLLRIQRQSRLQLDLERTRSAPLLESERDIAGNLVGPTPEAGVDPQDFRTLLGRSDGLSLNGLYARPFENGVSATVNGRLELTETEAQLGLPTARLSVPVGSAFNPTPAPLDTFRYAGGLNPLERRSEQLQGHLGVSVNGARAGWRWSFTGNADRTESKTLTDAGVDSASLQARLNAGDPALNPFGQIPADLLVWRAADLARSTVTSADASLLVNGALLELPAGAVNTAFTVAAETRQFESLSDRAGVVRTADLSRDIGRVQGSLDVPIASRRNEVLAGLGDLSINFNLAGEQLSDFGMLKTVGAGLNWSPIEPLRIIASVTEDDGAPTIQQLGDPEIATPLVRVFDFRTGQTVEVTRLSGGNPFLAAETRRTFKLGVNLRPWRERNLTVRADYIRERAEDVIASFPTATTEIEAAFPERFVRDAAGRLIQVDVRPVNFARQDREEVRWGFNYSRPFGPQRPPGGGQGGGRRRAGEQGAASGQGQSPGAGAPAVQGQARDGGGFGPGGPGGFGGRGFGGRGGFGGGGSIQLALFHTWRLQQEILIRPGVPVLDLLNGSAVGNGGGQSRHEIEAQAGVTRRGLGARMVARWRSGTEVRGGTLGGQDLTFSDLATVNLRLFADLGQQPFARQRTWLRGARVTLAVENLFDARQEVRNAAGQVPVSYQPDLIDPLGRTVRLSVRKVFF